MLETTVNRESGPWGVAPSSQNTPQCHSVFSRRNPGSLLRNTDALTQGPTFFSTEDRTGGVSMNWSESSYDDIFENV